MTLAWVPANKIRPAAPPLWTGEHEVQISLLLSPVLKNIHTQTYGGGFSSYSARQACQA